MVFNIWINYQAESGASEVEAEVVELEGQVATLESEVRRLEAWRRQVMRRAGERREVQATLSSEELEALQRSEKQYQVKLLMNIYICTIIIYKQSKKYIYELYSPLLHT